MTDDAFDYIKMINQASRAKSPAGTLASVASTLTEELILVPAPNKAAVLLHIADYLADHAHGSGEILGKAYNAAVVAAAANPSLREPALIVAEKSMGLMNDRQRTVAQENTQIVASRMQPRASESHQALEYSSPESGAVTIAKPDNGDLPPTAEKKVAAVFARLKERAAGAGRG